MTRTATFAGWLNSLEWDGKKRLENWLLRTVHPYVRPTSRRYHHYLRLVGKSVVLAHVARALHPGTKYDHSVLLMGPQGVGKSLLIQTLVGAEHTDDGRMGQVVQRPGLHAYEVQDLQTCSVHDLHAFKAILSATYDPCRAAYGTEVIRAPREFLIWFTSHAEVLNPSWAQARRLWPVYVSRADLRWLRQHRAQVLAEAVEMYRNGARITPTPEQDQAYIQPEVARYQRSEVAA